MQSQTDSVIIGGTATNGIDEELSKIINIKLEKVSSRVFPDGESYIRAPSKLEGKDVILVQSTYPPQEKHIIELLLMLEAIKNQGPKRIISIVPYFAYGRQNERFLDGEALSIKVILEAMHTNGADVLITVTPHNEKAIKMFHGEHISIEPIKRLAKALPRGLKNPIAVAPDEGAIEKTETFAKATGMETLHLDKFRDKNTGEIRLKDIPHIKLKGRDVVLIDDVVSTGKTLALAARTVHGLGAKAVIACVVHPLMVKGCYESIKNAGIEQVISSNTIPNDRVKVVDISKDIAEALKTL
jgi:ribose-phosphate pyrophosphokinase